jgi:hypothetical protein
LATGDFDQLVHPLNPRDERVVPLFEKHTPASGKAGG